MAGEREERSRKGNLDFCEGGGSGLQWKWKWMGISLLLPRMYVTAFTICFRQPLSSPSLPRRVVAYYPILQPRERTACRAWQSNSHMEMEGQFLDCRSAGRMAYGGRGRVHSCFQCNSRPCPEDGNVFFLSRKAKGKNHFSALFSKRAKKCRRRRRRR